MIAFRGELTGVREDCSRITERNSRGKVIRDIEIHRITFLPPSGSSPHPDGGNCIYDLVQTLNMLYDICRAYFYQTVLEGEENYLDRRERVLLPYLGEVKRRVFLFNHIHCRRLAR